MNVSSIKTWSGLIRVWMDFKTFPSVVFVSNVNANVTRLFSFNISNIKSEATQLLNLNLCKPLCCWPLTIAGKSYKPFLNIWLSIWKFRTVTTISSNDGVVFLRHLRGLVKPFRGLLLMHIQSIVILTYSSMTLVESRQSSLKKWLAEYNNVVVK